MDNLCINKCENGFNVLEGDPRNSPYVHRIWVAKTPEELGKLVVELIQDNSCVKKQPTKELKALKDLVKEIETILGAHNPDRIGLINQVIGDFKKSGR